MRLRTGVMGTLLALAALPAGLVQGSQAPAAAGNWHGLLESPVGDIALTIKLQQLADGNWTGTLDIPAQQVSGIGLKGVTVGKDTIGFTLAAPGEPTFSGVFVEGGEAATGQLKQGSGSIPLKLARTVESLARIEVPDDSVSLDDAVGLPGERSFFASIRHPAIRYSSGPTTNAIDQLNRSIAEGKVRLKFEAASGYLRSLLEALDISTDSQALVFSRTSVQSSYISPANPRALYFSDSVVVGFIRNAPFLEVAVQDPRQGAVFYILDQRAADVPGMLRRDSCLGCHESRNSLDVPGMLVRSVAVGKDGTPALPLGNYVSDHRSPLEERWGGWYVTGESTAQHLGIPARTLSGRFNLDGYPTSYSDIGALLVFDHQMHMMNLLTRMGWEARVALYQQEKTAGGRDLSERLLATDAIEVVDYLLFVDEAPLGGRIETTSTFAETFAKRGPRDARGRSLRELDLDRRLMRYPCSYMIYSAAFEGLPAEARSAIYQRMWEVLSGRVQDVRYATLSAADRKAVIEILRDTKPDLPGYFVPR